ncbi:Bacteriocin [Tenacibaculum sp. 190524A05c]
MEIMKKTILNVKGATTLSKAQQQEVNGGIDLIGYGDLSKCGCDCAGNVTGPLYCQKFMACPQVYTCEEIM